MTGKSLLLTGGLLCALIGLTAADWVFTAERYVPSSTEVAHDPFPDGGSSSSVATDSSSSMPVVGVRPGVRRSSGPDVLELLIAKGFTFEETDELSLIRTVIAEGTDTVQSRVLLQNGDRTAFFAWAETPFVKRYFSTLKEALHASFSPDVRELIDETQTLPGRPTRNLLTFMDPNLSQERFVFVRVRELLLEFHVAPGGDQAVFDLIEALSE